MASPPKYKLTYFNTRGLAESIRWMFAYKNVPFEDYRIKEFPAHIVPGETPEWDALKPNTPYGTIPILEVDGNGEYLGESTAIARYVAREIGLEGKNNWEAAQADSIITYIGSGKKSKQKTRSNLNTIISVQIELDILIFFYRKCTFWVLGFFPAC